MFNWDLDTDLLALLPPWYREVLDYQQICNAESEQLHRLSDNIVHIDDNFYFQTMDEQAVSRWEEIFAILPDRQTETLAFRRERLLNRIRTRPPFTLAFLLQKLDELIGQGKWQIDIDSANYRLYIEYLLNQQEWEAAAAPLIEFEYLLSKIKPAHIMPELATKNQPLKCTVYGGGAVWGSLSFTELPNLDFELPMRQNIGVAGRADSIMLAPLSEIESR